ncbi:MAG TPA: helix-turn-helix transcriptional regulator, partial [Ferruginibacter sp.]|nr:helix-turn-helix transcriptional regulator [Ferruginibacter sp.]
YSQKHLIKLFKDHVGITPKGFLKIIRFQKAVQEIEASKNIHWARLALESGYYDQAHFIHDFKEFSGFTPQEYTQKQYDYLNYIAVG